MKQGLKLIACIFLLAIVIFVSCKKELKCYDCKENKPPIANAGRDTTIISPKDSTMLDGSASTDPDGTITSYKWVKIAGPVSSNILKPDSSKTIVKALVAGVYQFELTVTDNGGLSAKDTVQVNVNAPGNQPPVACAGADKTITLPTDTVTVDGSCSVDPDNNITGYAWTKISGPAATIATPNAVQTQVTGLAQGIYQFELKVADAGGLFSKDTVKITVNSAPVIVACDNSNRPTINAQLIPIGTLSKARIIPTVAAVGTKILFAGGRYDCPYCTGSSRVDIYDTVTKQWSTAELSRERFGMAAVTAGNKIFFAGGQDGDGAWDQLFSTVDIYDASTNTWSTAALTEKRGYIAAATVGNKVFFAGGGDGDDYRNPITNKVDIFDLSTNSWSTTSLSEARLNISAVAINHKIYFAGGIGISSASDKIDIYDDLTHSWTTTTLKTPMGELCGIATANKIYWAANCNVEIKDVNTGNSSTANLFQPGYWLIDNGENVVLKDNKLIFFRHLNPSDRFDIYDIPTNTWSIGVLPQNNIIFSSIISVNNTIYVAGGRSVINGARTNQVWKLEF